MNKDDGQDFEKSGYRDELLGQPDKETKVMKNKVILDELSQARAKIKINESLVA